MKRFTITLLFISLLLCSFRPKENKITPTKNVIIMLTDGTSTSLLSTARWYKSYMEGKISELNLDPYVCGLVKSYMSDAPIAGSAGAMSGYMTGIPQKSRAISIYPEPNPSQDIIDVDSTMANQPLATIMEAAKIEKGKAVGLVATVDFYHATPAACMAHAYDRGNRKEIVAQMASQNLDVMFAGGAKMITGRAKEILEAQGTRLIEKDVEAFRGIEKGKVWALLADRNLPYEMDRNATSSPSLAEMTIKAIDILSQDKDGFCLMVEGSQVDMAAHANDPLGTITEFIAFDDAVKVAIEFAEKDGNTTVVILSDHGNSGITMGDRHYEDYSEKGLDSMFLNMSKFKCSGSKLARLIKKAENDDVRKVFEENTGISLTAEEIDILIRRKDTNVKNYMSVTNSENLLAAVTGILTKHTHIGFVSGNHTGEDVFLAVYNPKGQIPCGVISNVEFNRYLCKVLGLKTSLADLTGHLYNKHTDILNGYEYSIKEGAYPQLHIKSDKGMVIVPAWESTIIIDGARHQMPAPAVYIPQNNTFYISKDIIKYL